MDVDQDSNQSLDSPAGYISMAGNKNSTCPLLVTREIYKGRVIFPKTTFPTGRVLWKELLVLSSYTPANFVCGGVYCFQVVCACVRPCVRASVRPSVTFCFFNNLKSHCWIFIKPRKLVHICKTNTLDKKVRARGQFYQSYFPL